MPGSTAKQSSTRISTGTKKISTARGRSNLSPMRPDNRSGVCATRTIISLACPISTALSASTPISRQPASTRCAPALGKIAKVRTVGGIVFPGSPLAATKDELEKLAGYWPDIEKSRAEAKRLLKEAGQEGLSFELLNRNIDQPYKYNGSWLLDEWRKI